jgi:mono/diheme cytochrome c family protein
MRRIALLGAACVLVAGAADQATLDRGKKIEQTTCLPCHSLRLIDAQRISRAAWDRELTKMAGWGWKADAADRAALLEYLAANFGDDKPMAPAEKSADGRGR